MLLTSYALSHSSTQNQSKGMMRPLILILQHSTQPWFICTQVFRLVILLCSSQAQLHPIMFPHIMYPFSINSHCSGNSVTPVISDVKAV